MAFSAEETARQLISATKGFDHLFANDIVEAKAKLAAEEGPFHAMGLGVCSFLEAALGMESHLMDDAVKNLAAAEAGAKKQTKISKTATTTSRFAPGLEWEVVLADAVILNGMTNVLSESYMGYLQCLYAMNSAHSRFTKLFKTVFPAGLDGYSTPSSSAMPSRKPSLSNLSIASSASKSEAPTPKSGIFGKWSNGFLSASNTRPVSPAGPIIPEGPIEELIVSGVAFGYGLFNLIFSLFPAKIRNVVGFLGFQHDRKLAMRALAVSAAQNDVHAVFAGLALMTYHGVVLLLLGWQADERQILKQYRAMVDRLLKRYPSGALWILNKAKTERMSGDADTAIKTLQDALQQATPQQFVQADALLVFELAWTLLSQRRYQESADQFMRMTEINSWSHATYYFLAAGCNISIGNLDKAKELLDAVPSLLDKKKIGGKDLPTEVFIKKKVAFYKEKQKRITGSEDGWVGCIKISIAEELAIFWNTHSRIPTSTAEAHIVHLGTLSPPTDIPSPLLPTAQETSDSPPDLDTPDELALRSLLLGINHRSAGAFGPARAFLLDAVSRADKCTVNTWIGSVAQFEVATLLLKERDVLGEAAGHPWESTLREAEATLDKAVALSNAAVDLSSRLDSRIAMLRDEIAAKRELVGLEREVAKAEID